ncbi:hypothetical protein BDV11DRAFT_207903 [Aspergillus similis]
MATTTNSLSLRPSCERCRFHKLKCTISSEDSTDDHPRCVRCPRAKVECAFGRRSRGRRHQQGASTSQMDWGLNLPTTTRPRSIEDGGWAHPNISNVSVIFLPVDRQDSRWIDLQGEGNGIPAASLSHGPTDNVQSCISSISDTKGPDEVLQLSMLVAKINETINSLQRGSCATINNASDLDDYPIGSVLQSYRDFLCILRGMQRTEPFLSPDLNDAKSLGLTGVKGIGVSSELLIISCYISLTNLCSIVLDHFERYIRLQSEAGSNRWTTVVEPFQTPDILLRELPGAGETWSKACPDDSVVMSQEQGSEACVDVIGVFVHSVMKIGLFQKVDSLKQLLRARMNL